MKAKLTIIAVSTYILARLGCFGERNVTVVKHNSRGLYLYDGKILGITKDHDLCSIPGYFSKGTTLFAANLMFYNILCPFGGGAGKYKIMVSIRPFNIERVNLCLNSNTSRLK